MTPAPYLTIVVPTYNQAGTIAQTLQSILDQGLGPDLQLVVVDACSNDGTEPIVRGFEPRFRAQGADWTYLREKDRGQGDAINKGWRLARGVVLGYLNSDDYYLPGALRTVVDFFRAHPDTPWAYGGWQLVGRDGRVYATVRHRRFRRARLLNYSNIGQPSCFFRREMLAQFGELNIDLHLALDYDLWLRFAAAHDAAIIPADLSAMRYYADAKSVQFTYRQLREILRLGARYTHPLGWRRLCQYFYYLRGVAVNLLRVDVARRIERARRKAAPP